MEPSGSTRNDTTVGTADRPAGYYVPIEVSGGTIKYGQLIVSLVPTRAPLTKKERRRWINALNSFRIKVEVPEWGRLLDLSAYDLYLTSLLRWSPTDPKQILPPAL